MFDPERAARWLRTQRFSVVGAGRSGRAAANALVRVGPPGIDVRLVDSKPGMEQPEDLDERVAFEAGTNSVRPGDVAVLSPGIKQVSPLHAEIAAVASESIGEVELFYRLSPAPILAVTGTDGKSTTTTMLGAILEAAGEPTFVGGNLGNPLCESLGELTPAHVVVAEISAFQLITTRHFRPRVAVVTNIAEDHLDYHGGFEPYQAAKRRIWAEMTAADVLVLNGDDSRIASWPLPGAPTMCWFTIAGRADAAASYDGEGLWVRSGGRLQPMMSRGELPLLGDHNAANALAAATAAHQWGVPLELCRRALSEYRPLAHRLEPIAQVDGVRWVNDSKATNPNAASAGIRAIDAPLVLLAGGSSKDADFALFGRLVRQRARHVILFGQTRDELARAIGDGPPVERVATLDEAVARAHVVARAGDTVLLGPACASYDQFRSFVHRGEVFTDLVARLQTTG